MVTVADYRSISDSRFMLPIINASNVSQIKTIPDSLNLIMAHKTHRKWSILERLKYQNILPKRDGNGAV